MTWLPDELLRIVQASPERVAAHDRTGWLALFAREAEVEDPVGAPVHRRALQGPQSPSNDPRTRFDDPLTRFDDPLARFWDTFIGPNEIRFEVHADACADLAVARHVTIHTRLDGGLGLSIPAYLLYDLVVEEGHLKIRRLAAHWSVARAALAGPPRALDALRGALGQAARLLAHQGLGGTIAYSLGLGRNLVSRSPALLARLTAAVNQRDPEALAALLRPGEPGAACPDATVLDAAALVRTLSTPGPFQATEPIATSRSLAFRYSAGPGEADPRGIAFFERVQSQSRSGIRALRSLG